VAESRTDVECAGAIGVWLSALAEEADLGSGERMLDYLDVLADLHHERRPRTYLEIGIYRGDALRLASPETLSVGVDPEPEVAQLDGPNVLIEAMTSDAFFAGPRPREIFADHPIDLVFIDGMHLFEFALRDFINAEALTGHESLIVLHDCLPSDATTAARDRTTDHWTGDIWKLMLCLLDHRPDLDLSIIDVAPSGLCLVSGLDPASRALADDYGALVERYVSLDFSVWEARFADVLERTTNGPEAELWRRRELTALRLDLQEVEALRARLADSEAEVARLRDGLARSEAERSSLADQMRAVSSSRSWRLTAPLRRVAGSSNRSKA
jgi:Methyltransferase domain